MPDIDYNDLVRKVQGWFVEKGLMKPVKVQSLDQRVGDLLGGYGELLEDDLRSHWSTYFPGVSFSEGRLSEAIEVTLQKKRREVVASFEETLKKRATHIKIMSWFISKGLMLLVLLGFLCLACFVVSASLIFSYSDVLVSIGMAGLALGVIILVCFILYARYLARSTI